jgi:hypothetical protein
VGRDVEGYAADLGQAKNKIFLQSRIDEALVYSWFCQPLVLVVLPRAAVLPCHREEQSEKAARSPDGAKRNPGPSQ